MHYDIRHEAGQEFAELERRIEELTPEIAPHVPEVTALPMPDRLIIRIVRVPQWMDLWERYDEQLLASEIAELVPTASEIEQARAAKAHVREYHRGAAIGAQTVSYYDEQPSVVVLADNLRTAGHVKVNGVNTDYVRNMLAHELTHVGQLTAGGTPYRLLVHTPFGSRRPFTERDWFFAGEGYAVWAERQIASQIHGAAKSDKSLTSPSARPGSSRWSGSNIQTEVLDHIVSAAAAGAVGGVDHRRTVRRYRAAGRAMEEVIGACGVQAVNRMWTRHDLLPTDAEEHDYVAWQRRLMGLAPQIHHGPGDFAAGVIPGVGTRSVAVRTPGR
ncbi:MAG: hypothetical protein HOY69_37440 [Streptomyces sp.]|nr:hypothetical protein [Streptomyces sp.]